MSLDEVNPEDFYYESLLDQLVTKGHMEEVSPGMYRLTEEGKAWVESKKDEPWVKELWRRLDEVRFREGKE